MTFRTVRASIAFGFLGMSLYACAQQPKPQPTSAAPVTSAKAPSKSNKPYAGTVGVPSRRHVRGDEMTTEIAKRAREILDSSSDSAYGTEVPFEVDGQGYIGRIEEHYHEPGGPKKPWGRHRGVTVYHAD
ncbi:MAG: hypothetical protein ABW133_15520 [Polyangiaceae bacterium]